MVHVYTRVYTSAGTFPRPMRPHRQWHEVCRGAITTAGLRFDRGTRVICGVCRKGGSTKLGDQC